MKLFLLAIVTMAFLPLHAQVSTPPIPNFPGFQIPPYLAPAGGGFMSLRSKAPFRAVVEKKTVTPESYTITIKTDSVSQTFSESPPGAEALKMLNHLVVGRAYDFPAVFDQVLGKKSAAASTPAPPWPTSLHLADLQTKFPELTKCEPFRARVAKKQIGNDSVSIELHCTDGRQFSVTQSGAGMDEARRIAGLLKEGEVHEFPDDVRAQKSVQNLAKNGAGAPVPSTEMRALEGFIGEWEMPMLNEPDRKLILAYVWKKDGRGLWREIRGEPRSETKKVESAWLITFDPARKCYVETATRPNVRPRETDVHWDPATQTLTSRTIVDFPEPGTTQTGTRRIVSGDRLEWRFGSVSAEGRPSGENSGHYIRAKR